MNRNIRKIFFNILSVAFLLVLWSIASQNGLFGKVDVQISRLLLPPPEYVLHKLLEMLASGYLLENIWTSLQRVLTGFLLAVGIGIPAGIFMGINDDIYNLLYPMVRIISPIPGVAWIPLAILWFGLGNRAAIFIITISSISPIIVNVLQGMKAIDHNLKDVMYILHANKLQEISYLIIPSLMPYIITGFKLSLGYAWRVVIAAELVGVPGGLGYVLNLGRSTAQTEVTLIVIFTLSFLLIMTESLLFKPLEQMTDQWRAIRNR